MWIAGHEKPSSYCIWEDDDAWTFTKYLDYLKLPTMYFDPDELVDEDESLELSAKDNRRRSMRSRMSMPRLGSSLHTIFGTSSSKDGVGRNNKIRSSMDSEGKRKSVGFFDSIRSMGKRAVSFRFNTSSSNFREKPGSFLNAIKEGVALQEEKEEENKDAKISSYQNLIDTQVLDEEDIVLDDSDILDEIGPPPTPIVLVATTKSESTHVPPELDAPKAPISPKSKLLENLTEEVLLGHVFLRHLKKNEMELQAYRAKNVDTLQSLEPFFRRHRIRIANKSCLEAIDMSNSSDSVIEEGPPITEIDIYESTIELLDVWRCELYVLSSSFTKSPSSPQKILGSNTTRVAGVVFKCRHGIEQLYELLNVFQTRGAKLSQRCEQFLNEIEKLRCDEIYVKTAKHNLAKHIDKLSWGLVKSVLSKTDITHQKNKLRREFLSREYQTRFYQRAQITPAKEKSVPMFSDDDVNLSYKEDGVSKEGKEKEEKEEFIISSDSKYSKKQEEEVDRKRPKAISSMIDMWTSQFETMGKTHRARLQENITRSTSISNMRGSRDNESNKRRSRHFSSVSSRSSQNFVYSKERKSSASTLGLAESRIMRMSVENDAKRDGGIEHDLLPIWNTEDCRNLCQKIAIFVLGPSASGKTHMTRQNLTKILEANGLSKETTFISIDGGIMRDCSRNWGRMKRRHTREYKGFKDLFGGYFQPMVRQFKKRCFQALLTRGVNMIIPETAVNVSSTVEHYHGPASKGKAKIMFDKLKAEGYTILMTAVHASKLKCMDNGKCREVLEGKKYKNSSWGVAIGSIARMFNYSRSEGYLHETFFVLDNTCWDHSETLLVPPFHGLRLESMIEESQEVEEAEEEDSRGKWATYVIPRSGTLYELSKDSKNEVYYFWEHTNFEIKNQWLKNLDTGVKWDLSHASLVSYVNGIKDIVTTSESLTPRLAEHDDLRDRKDRGDEMSLNIRNKALSTRVNVIEITISEKSKTHHQGDSIVLSPESSQDLGLWIGTIIAASRWGALHREESEEFGQMNL